jgi:hypothetical protein
VRLSTSDESPALIKVAAPPVEAISTAAVASWPQHAATLTPWRTFSTIHTTPITGSLSGDLAGSTAKVQISPLQALPGISTRKGGDVAEWSKALPDIQTIFL